MKKINKVLFSIAIASTVLFTSGCSQKVLEPTKLESQVKNVEIIKLGEHKIHTFYGISNSHVIETPNKLIVFDAQFTFKLANSLKNYLKTLNKPIEMILLSHAHPDHWFGSQMFEGVKVVATPEIQTDLKNHGQRYIKIMKPKLKDNMPNTVVKIDEFIKMGKHNWDGLEVILEEYKEQEAHNSIAIKIPKYGVFMGQDLFYHNTHLVASDKQRNKNWAKILKGFLKDEAKHYKTILVGHGLNTDPKVINEDIIYLEKLDEILESGANMEETKAALIKAFPQKEKRGFINITVRNLFKKH